jgi:hypothetical protein
LSDSPEDRLEAPNINQASIEILPRVTIVNWKKKVNVVSLFGDQPLKPFLSFMYSISGLPTLYRILRHEFEADKRNSDAWANINPSQALINAIM